MNFSDSQIRAWKLDETHAQVMVQSSPVGDMRKVMVQAFNRDENETLVDSLALFRSVASQVGVDQRQLAVFEEFATMRLILHHMESPTTEEKNLSGIGLFFPNFPEDLEEYSCLKIYSDTKLADLFEVVIPSRI